MFVIKECKNLSLLFREPKLPIIIITNKCLYTYYNFDQLIIFLKKIDFKEEYLKMIDITGEEFWFYKNNNSICPGFLIKKWTKKQIIDLYNSKYPEYQYTKKSISNIKFNELFNRISNLILNNQLI